MGGVTPRIVPDKSASLLIEECLRQIGYEVSRNHRRYSSMAGTCYPWDTASWITGKHSLMAELS